MRIAFCGCTGAGRTTAALTLRQLKFKQLKLADYDQFNSSKWDRLLADLEELTGHVVVPDVTTTEEVLWLKSIDFKVVFIYNASKHATCPIDEPIPHLIPLQVCHVTVMNTSDIPSLYATVLDELKKLFPDEKFELPKATTAFVPQPSLPIKPSTQAPIVA